MSTTVVMQLDDVLSLYTALENNEYCLDNHYNDLMLRLLDYIRNTNLKITQYTTRIG